jgi:hypothetical protein
MMRKLLLLIAITTLVSACGTNAPAAQPTAVPAQFTAEPAQPTELPTAPTPAPVPTAQPSQPYPGPDANGGGLTAYPVPADGQTQTGNTKAPTELVQAARERLARLLERQIDTLTLQSASSQQWPDASMGCPDPATTYAQYSVPGYLLVFSDGSRSYDVHTGLTATPGEPMVLCEQQRPVSLDLAPTNPVQGSLEQNMVDLAKQDLAQRTGAALNDIQVATVAPVEWNDSSLGCAKPGVNYLQVITSGYLIRLDVQGRGYEYHTDTNRTVILCTP